MRYIPMNHTPVRRRNSFKFFKKILTLGFVVAAFVIIIIWDSRNYKYLVRQSSELLQRSLYVSDEEIESVALARNISPSWHFIGHPKLKFQVYSAYFDDRLEIVENLDVPKHEFSYGSVRIIAILPLRIDKSSVGCHFKYRKGHLRKIKALNVDAIHEHFEMPFSASFVVCPLLQNTFEQKVELPVSVGISYEKEVSLMGVSKFTVIRYPKFHLNSLLPPKLENKIAVCVGPAQNYFSNVLRIVEFVELYKQLGASKFYFYKNSVSDDVDRLFKYYQKQGIVEIFNWNLTGYQFESEVRYGGIFASLNDCIYKATIVDNMKYTAIVDFDEIIVPFRWTSLLSFLEAQDTEHVHSFNFQNVFFFYEFNGDFSTVPNDTTNPFLYTQVQITRTKEPLVHHSRSKYIAKGKSIIELGNHKVWQALEDTKEYQVVSEEGLMFHYRQDCLFDHCLRDVKNDTRARLYGNFLWKKVDKVCGDLFETHLCPMR